MLFRSDTRRQHLKKEIASMESKIESLKKAIQNLYVDKANGLISANEYIEFRKDFSAEIERYSKLQTDRTSDLEALEAEGKIIHSKEEILKKYKNVTQLDRDIMDAMIDYIEIGRCEKKVHRNDLPPITIHWKF